MKTLVTKADSIDLAQLEAQFNTTISNLVSAYRADKLTSFAPVLPYFFRLKNKPYTLLDHFPMEPLFSTQMPQHFIYKCGRQVSKTTTFSAQAVLQALLIPYVSILFMAPRFPQIRMISSDYVRVFLESSPVSHLLLAKNFEQSVFKRTLVNNSLVRFSFAFLSVGRIRGISADFLKLDELQDFDNDFLPIIEETLSASPYAITQYSGTPKTLDNVLQYKWEASSQAEWVTPCEHCNHWNIATIYYDLLDMIQESGLVCAKCGRPINPRIGFYEHKYPEKRASFPGYHVPQPIMPNHYEPSPLTGQKTKWRIIYLAKQGNIPQAAFFNEKLGEAWDTNVALISRHNLERASVLTHENKLKDAIRTSSNYTVRYMGVDWGGGGESGMSFTTVAILGFTPNGGIDLIYGERLSTLLDPVAEAALIIKYMQSFNCLFLAHDFGGAGSLRETMLLQRGFDPKKLFPCSYTIASASPVVTYHAPSAASTRSYYNVDKTRSLLMLCHAIKQGLFRFPKYESWQDLGKDFLGLVEEKRESTVGSDITVITHKSGVAVDFAHSVNFATMAFWHINNAFPNFGDINIIKSIITKEAEQTLDPENCDEPDASPVVTPQ